jgi:NOL1/NOP2/fmu family ribosome biogenesis protein
LTAKSNLLAKSILDNFCRDNLSFSFDASRLILEGTYIYQLPNFIPNLEGLNVIHPGWWLGSIRKGRFTPSHSLAMGINIDQAQHILLRGGDQRLLSYFSGESFPDTGENAWILVTVDGFPVGWGKRVQHLIKNYYPHGLRRIT